MEYRTIHESLLRHRNSPVFHSHVEGVGIVATVPDGSYTSGVLEVKDWIYLSRSIQIRAQGQLAWDTGRHYVLICTTRTKKISGPLLEFIKTPHPTDPGAMKRYLLRKDINGELYRRWIFNNPNDPSDLSGQWLPISTEQIQTILAP